jgi:hypothetical protein
MDMTQVIGWSSAVVLLPTFGVQVYRQWQKRREPVPAATIWFFLLAVVGTGGQMVYSWLVGNAVYFVLNAILVVTNSVGLGIDVYRWKGPPSRREPSESSE